MPIEQISNRSHTYPITSVFTSENNSNKFFSVQSSICIPFSVANYNKNMTLKDEPGRELDKEQFLLIFVKFSMPIRATIVTSLLHGNEEKLMTRFSANKSKQILKASFYLCCHGNGTYVGFDDQRIKGFGEIGK